MQPSHQTASGHHRTSSAGLPSRALTLFALVLLLLQCPAARSLGSRQDAKPQPADAAWLADLQTWRTQHQQELADPHGWLTLVALAWIHPGDNTLGSAADNSIRINNLPAHLGILHLDGVGVTLRPLPSGIIATLFNGNFPRELQLNGKPATNDGALLKDDEENPAIAFNSLTMYVIHRGDRVYLRVKDTQSPTLRDFHGLHWYAPDARYRVRARWIPTNPPEKIRIANVIGQTIEMPSPGVAEFTINGQTVRLHPVLEQPGDRELFFLFRDTTAATTTYPAGRFLYADFPDHGLDKPGTIVIDFNTAYNPPCAFTPFATCPLPAAQNRLTLPIPAGEKRYHDD